jgi:hypothetical protein
MNAETTNDRSVDKQKTVRAHFPALLDTRSHRSAHTDYVKAASAPCLLHLHLNIRAHAQARARTHAHTHTHTHIYIYTYIHFAFPGV